MTQLGMMNLAPSSHLMLVTGTTGTRYPVSGIADATNLPNSSHIRFDTLVNVVGLWIFTSGASGFITLQLLDLTPIFRVAFPVRTGQQWIPFGRSGIIVPLGFSAKSSTALVTYAVSYRRLQNERTQI
jgi:hypothetical protein